MALTMGGNACVCCRDYRFTLEEVRADHGEEVWVTLKDTRGVYNVSYANKQPHRTTTRRAADTPPTLPLHVLSAFLDAHPGGADRIRMVNGQDLSAFWAVYSDIHNRAHIRVRSHTRLFKLCCLLTTSPPLSLCWC